MKQLVVTLSVISLACAASAHPFDINDRHGQNDSTIPEYRLDVAKAAVPNTEDKSEEYTHLVYTSRGNSYFEKRQYDRAITDYDTALHLKPDFAPAYYNRGLAHGHTHRYQRAAIDFDTVVHLQRDNARAHNSLAWLLATAPRASVRDGARAMKLALRAVSLRNVAEYRDTLAAAYAEAGRFTEAVREQKRAIEMARREGIANLAGWKFRLRLFKRGRTFREGVEKGLMTVPTESGS